jgi:hypothetical protein
MISNSIKAQTARIIDQAAAADQARQQAAAKVIAASVSR